jgi:hypothetical protein
MRHLKDHINTHDKPFMCETCGAMFSLQSLLTHHELKHKQSKPQL